MSTDKPTTDPYRTRIEQFSAEERQRALDRLAAIIDADAIANIKTCVHCGLCADSCHYYLATGQPEAIPAHKLNLVASVMKAHHTMHGSVLGRLFGARDLDAATVDEWIDSLYGRCSGCGRCSINCTVGIHIARLIRMGRTALAEVDLVPPELQATVTTAVETGNNMGIPQAEWVDTVEWLTEELQGETGDPNARLPLDQVGARYMYTVNPREPKFFPLSLLATAKIFYAAGESWTLSRNHYDVTNYGLFSGNDQSAGLISDRLRNSLKALKAEILILGECGHGYTANRWETPNWLGRPDPCEVISVIQLIAQYVKDKRITLDPSKVAKRVTLHDPCNLVRNGGVIEEQRYILKHAVADFVEMTPNRIHNFCCGGGGGQLSMTRFAKRRVEAGKIKADQIRATGAQIVVAPCHNCIDQLSELNKEYKLGVEIKTVSEVVADALVLPAR